MFMDLKYHIVSLVAVFLALGIGILIGSTMISGDAVIQRQEEIVDSIKKDFQTLSSENKTLKENIDKQNEKISEYIVFQEKVLPIITGNKIPGKKVAIVKTNPDFDASIIKKDMLGSGGVVISETTFEKDFMRDFDSNVKLLKSLSMSTFSDNADENSYYMVNMIASYVLGGNNSGFATALGKEGAVSFSGSYDSLPDVIVMVGGADSEKNDSFTTVDDNLIKSFKNKNIRVIGCETSSSQVSYTGRYIERKISTVDNVDVPAGRISLILLIAGDMGNYGDKDSANLPYPKNIQ